MGVGAYKLENGQSEMHYLLLSLVVLKGHVEVASPSFIWLLLQKNKITLQLSEVLLVHTHTVRVGYRITGSSCRIHSKLIK